MATIYVPRLIETAAQAEALPEGTVAVEHDDDWHDAAVKVPGNVWREASADNWCVYGGDLIGWSALVPIEAEEETRVTPEALVAAAGQVLARVEETARTYALPPTPLTIQQQTRLVTPWEET